MNQQQNNDTQVRAPYDSGWNPPIRLVDPNHEHSFTLAHPSHRRVRCSCGFGGDVYPHNTIIKDGHIYKLDGTLVI